MLYIYFYEVKVQRDLFSVCVFVAVLAPRRDDRFFGKKLK
jgi:hypothetical protein